MMTFHPHGKAAVDCTELGACSALTNSAVWIDLFEPTSEEERAVESALGIDVPTREEMQTITISSRLYHEGDILFMTATILTKADSSHPEASAVTFILTPERLITVRYTEPTPFVVFRSHRERHMGEFDSGARILEGLLDAIVERIAEILEQVGSNLDALSLEVFAPRPKGKRRATPSDFQEMLGRLGRYSDLCAKARESLVSLARLLSFYRESDKKNLVTPEQISAINAHIVSVGRELNSLSDHATFLSGKISFLLDATLGLISVEQNAIIKIVSVAAVVFLPPTLVASIYGMNFDVMPELKWLLGYPFALVLMVISAILPFYVFKKKGWL